MKIDDINKLRKVKPEDISGKPIEELTEEELYSLYMTP